MIRIGWISSPCILPLPQRGFSLARSRMSCSISASILGRPPRFRSCRYVHFRLTSSRCHFNTVSGLNINMLEPSRAFPPLPLFLSLSPAQKVLLSALAISEVCHPVSVPEYALVGAGPRSPSPCQPARVPRPSSYRARKQIDKPKSSKLLCSLASPV